MGEDMTKVESFELDHQQVEAPYIREAAVYRHQDNCVVSKYDIRFCQPNQEALKPAVMHSIEHLAAEYLRDMLDGVIDISPMGCLTGFYLNLFGERELEVVKQEVLAALKEASQAEEVMATNPKQCGNYKLHNPKAAKERLARFIKEIN